MFSIKRNILFNYIGQFYIAFIGILVLPLYLEYMGGEAYGLIGFFTLLQSWMQLLDLGLSPTMGREVARLRVLPFAESQLRSVVRSLEIIFICIALAVGLMVFVSRHWIGREWLNIEKLDLGLVTTCIGLMGVMISVRWLASLHRSGINAYEQQVWMNITDIILVTLRFPGSLLLIIFSDGNVLYFFVYQLLLALIEQLTISKKFYSLLPNTDQKVVWFNLDEVRRIAPFCLGIAYTGSIWILVSQLDKLLLSKTLPLAEYGYFTLVATVATGISVLSSPISKAVLPRMTALLAQGKDAEMLLIYRKASRFVVCMIAPIALVLAFFPEHIIYIWTGNLAAVEWTASILPLFVLGNGLLAILAFQYYLQYAHGKLKLHVLYNTGYLVVFSPLIFYAVFNYGPLGAGVVWLSGQLFTLVVWMPLVHKVYAPGINKKWLLNDIAPPILLNTIGLYFVLCLFEEYIPTNRFYGFLFFSSIIIFSIGGSLLLSFYSEIRSIFITVILKKMRLKDEL